MHTLRSFAWVPLAAGTMLMATPASVARTEAPRAGPEIGQAAPAFTLPDTYGKEHSLAQYQGKWVVLEWLNYDCPYVKKHYSSGNIPGQQKKWTEKGVVWLAVVSSAPGKQGYFEAADMNARSAQDGSNATAVLLDPEGTVGHAVRRAYHAAYVRHRPPGCAPLHGWDRRRTVRAGRGPAARDATRRPGAHRALRREAGERAHVPALRVLGEVRGLRLSLVPGAAPAGR